MKSTTETMSKPSPLYCAGLWRIGLALSGHLPISLLSGAARVAAWIYWRLARRRREIVIHNLLPVLEDRVSAERYGQELLNQFTLKLIDLWQFERGVAFDCWTGEWNGWHHFTRAHARGKGVLLVTPHLGNWEFGGAFLIKHGYQLLVLTQPEPDSRLTRLRQAARQRRGIETLVVGEDAFAFVEIIKQLQAGKTVALLVDRPPPPTAVEVELFGRPFSASIAMAELARASGCAIIPGYIVREQDSYRAHILPEITYDRTWIGTRPGRVQLTQEILHGFEPAIREHLTQWFHFVPIWPPPGNSPAPTKATQ